MPALKSFAMKAADGGMAEVELGKLAAQKGSNDRVKQFGQKMVDDHSKANDDLKQAASQAGIELPADTSAKHKQLVQKLSGLSGAAFDKAYMDAMVKDHVEDVAGIREGREGARQLPDQDVRREHASHAEGPPPDGARNRQRGEGLGRQERFGDGEAGFGIGQVLLMRSVSESRWFRAVR